MINVSEMAAGKIAELLTEEQKAGSGLRVFVQGGGCSGFQYGLMKFGSEGIEIAAVPPGDVTTARPDKAHYHVGIDQDCLPPGQNIVKGTPSWVHFGDGKDVFDSQLTPGKHKLALQLGDDLHNTLPNTCTVITVNVK